MLHRQMQVLIVHAHPESQSFNGALTRAAVEELKRLNVGVEVSDLYAQNFQPVANREDFHHLASPARLGYVHEQRHATASRGYSADILREQDRVIAADVLIFQFPLWWYAVPAILKGWADRVLTHGFAYTDECLFDDGLLRGKRAMLSVTTGGTEEELYADSKYTGTVEEFLRPFSGGVLRFVGMNVDAPHIAYAPASQTHEQRERVIEDYLLRIRELVSDADSQLMSSRRDG